jgi:TIR domain/Pentapeptide repeats (8 copies)
MDREEALTLLRGGADGVRNWNQRLDEAEMIPDLGGVDLSGTNLFGVNLSRVELVKADLIGVDLNEADLRETDLSQTNLSRADLIRAKLIRANLFGTNMREANLDEADPREADLIGANLSGVDLGEADLSGANLSDCSCGGTLFANVDLSNVKSLESIRHYGPSTIGVDTIIKSRGNIPEVFLRGCGVPDVWINNIPALIGGMQPIQFYSCFISYSGKDDDFAKRLHGRLVQEKLRVWFAPEDIQGGKKIHEQIDEAIRLHDKLLLILSANSMGSEWVKTELRKAFKQERREGKRKLFPIGLTSYEEVRDWECFDADHGKDLAVEVREYYVPDFSNWKDHDAFEAGFAKLLRDLKADQTAAAK